MARSQILGPATRERCIANQEPQVVTVWSDIGCPWATLALETLRSVGRKHALPILVDHRAFPLELFNRQPTPKPIIDAEIVAIAGVRPELGWRSWAKPDSTYPVTTLPALEAVQAAKSEEVGGLRASDELDSALRRAFYVDGACISIHAVILEVAAGCELVDEQRLRDLLARGAGRAEVFAQWRTAQGEMVQGSPHFFSANGYARHNPGVTYHWTAPPAEGGFPRLEHYDVAWVDELLELVGTAARA
jgi:predicted DsbA family dithiol-disulfide isomerase